MLWHIIYREERSRQSCELKSTQPADDQHQAKNKHANAGMRERAVQAIIGERARQKERNARTSPSLSSLNSIARGDHPAPGRGVRRSGAWPLPRPRAVGAGTAAAASSEAAAAAVSQHWLQVGAMVETMPSCSSDSSRSSNSGSPLPLLRRPMPSPVALRAYTAPFLGPPSPPTAANSSSNFSIDSILARGPSAVAAAVASLPPPRGLHAMLPQHFQLGHLPFGSAAADFLGESWLSL